MMKSTDKHVDQNDIVDETPGLIPAAFDKTKLVVPVGRLCKMTH